VAEIENSGQGVSDYRGKSLYIGYIGYRADTG
jgi:ribosomal protein L6P/L9E